MLKNTKNNCKQQFSPWQIDVQNVHQQLFLSDFRPDNLGTQSAAIDIDDSKKMFLKEENQNQMTSIKLKYHSKKQSFLKADAIQEQKSHKRHMKEGKCSQSFSQLSKMPKKSEILKQIFLHLNSTSGNRIAQSSSFFQLKSKNKKKNKQYRKTKNLLDIQKQDLKISQNKKIEIQQIVSKQFNKRNKQFLKVFNMKELNQQEIKNEISNLNNQQHKKSLTKHKLKSSVNFETICLPNLNLNFDQGNRQNKNQISNSNILCQDSGLDKNCEKKLQKQQRIQRSLFKKHKKKRSDIMFSLKNLKQQSMFANNLNLLQKKNQPQYQQLQPFLKQENQSQNNITKISNPVIIKSNQQQLQFQEKSQFFDEKMKITSYELKKRKILLMKSCQESPSFNYQKSTKKTSFINEYLKIKQKKNLQQQQSKVKTRQKMYQKKESKSKACSLNYRSVLPKIQIFYQNQIGNCDLVS